MQLVKCGMKGGKIPLSGFDIVGGHHFSWHTYLYKKCPDQSLLIDCLKKTIRDIPTFAGRMKSNSEGIYIDCNDAGIHFYVEEINQPIPHYGKNHSVDPDHKKYIPPVPTSTVDTDEPLCKIKLTKFRCGSCIIGVVWSHSLVDGMGYMSFVTRWARYVRGIKQTEEPQLNRECLIKIDKFRSTDPSEFSTLKTLRKTEDFVNKLKIIYFGSRHVEHHAFEMTRDQMDIIKSLKENPPTDMAEGIRISYNDFLTALLWKRVSSIQKTTHKVALGTVVNLRGMEGLNVQKDYIGNAVALSFIHLHPDELLLGSAFSIAGKIRQGTKRVNYDSVMQEISYMKSALSDKNKKLVDSGPMEVYRGGFLCNNVSRFPIHELDFNVGKPYWIDGPSRKYGYRYCSIFPTGDNDGSVINHLVLPKSEMHEFKKMYINENKLKDCFFKNY